jgi:hypothetical protein
MEDKLAIFVTIHNSDIRDLFVTVLDLNLPGTPAVLQNQRFNQDQSTQIPVQEDGSGNGNIQWTAQSVDDPSVTAQRTVAATNNTTVDVTTHFG